MASICFSEFLLCSPDDTIDHNYLTDAEIESLDYGVYYKKKKSLTRHRFIKAALCDGDRVLDFEVVDNRGYWRVEQSTVSRIQQWLSRGHDCHTPQPEEVLAACGLADRVMLMDAPLPPGTAELPRSLEEMAMFYATYTDMLAQGHFDSDSPDLERFELLLGWVPPTSLVLDIGCNSGAFGAALGKKNCQVSGVDLSQALVNKARQRGINAVRAFAENLPFPDNAFDVAICAELLEHVLEPLVVLREAHRVLKPGGLLVGSIPHADGQWGHADIGYHPEHLRAFDTDDLEGLLHSAGFRSVDLVEQYYGSPVPEGLAFRCWS